jgi:hypothetical protein
MFEQDNDIRQIGANEKRPLSEKSSEKSLSRRGRSHKMKKLDGPAAASRRESLVGVIDAFLEWVHENGAGERKECGAILAGGRGEAAACPRSAGVQAASSVAARP